MMVSKRRARRLRGKMRTSTVAESIRRGLENAETRAAMAEADEIAKSRNLRLAQEILNQVDDILNALAKE